MVARPWFTNPALLLAISALACASTPPASQPSSNAAVNPPPTPDARPDWSARPAVVASEDDRHVLYGVGRSSGIAQPGLARASAERRAKEEIARTLRRLMEEADHAQPESGEVDDALAAAESAALSEVRIVDYWSSATADQNYARARLDVSAVLAGIDRQTKLDAQTKAQMAARILAMVRGSTSDAD